ncbi:MAG: cytochrome c biogenesis protein CcdA [Myxococcales bacterium]|nr:cytochrome c biogenesis protein CcdA [Myxococcales bacterium]
MTEISSHAYLAFAAGVLSVLSPCVLPLMPAYLSLISGLSVEQMQEAGAGAPIRRRVMLACCGFIAGFSVVFVLMGVGAVAAGRLLRTWRAEVFGIEFGAAQITGVLIILLGLHMTGITPIRALYRDTRFHFHLKRRSVVSAFIVGAGFALGWSPCIGPILATILTVAGSRETAMQGVVLLTIYSAGLAVPFLIAGWSIDYFFGAFKRIKLHFRKLEIASGVILMSVGFLLVTGQLSTLNSRFGFMTDWLTAAERALQ